MLNQMSVDAVCSASYIEDFLDCVENLPDDLQRNISHMRELDVKYQVILEDLESYHIHMMEELDGITRKRMLLHIQRALIKSQELGDEKLQVVQTILDLIENKARQLDLDFKNAGVKTIVKDQENAEPVKPDPQPERSSKRARRQRNDTAACQELAHERIEEKLVSGKKSKKKKRKSKAEKEMDDSPVDQPIDPDEPTYCLCQQISYGEMIGCDNDRCRIEWYHFSCVGLTTKPKGKWYCPKCRGDRPNIMKARP